MAATLVQRTSGNGGGYVNSYTKAFSSNITAGNTLFCVIGCGDGDIPTITDNNSGTWVQKASQTLASQRKVQIWEALNHAAGATTLTIAFQGGQFSDSAIIIWEESGLTTAANLDQTTGAAISAGSSYASGATSATTQATEYVVGALVVDMASPTLTADAGFNTIVSQAGFDLYTSVHIQDKNVTSTGAQSITITNTTNQNASILIATFKDVPPAVTAVSKLGLAGVG